MEAGDRCRRRDGIRESASDGISSLYWEVGDTRFVTTGPDIEVLYDVVDRLQAIEPTADLDGYVFVGGLPAGTVELDPLRPLAAGWFPGIVDSNEGARLTLYMDDQSPLQAMIQGGGEVHPVTSPAIRATSAAVTDRSSVSRSRSPLTRPSRSPTAPTEAELIAIAERIEFTDEPTWRAHYGVTWGNGQGDFPIPLVRDMPIASTERT